jgi:hypothetical protein
MPGASSAVMHAQRWGDAVRYLRKGRVLAAVAVAFGMTCVFGVGAAQANVVFTASPRSSLVDGLSVVQVMVTNIHAVPNAHITFSECANAYANGTPLPAGTLTLSTDCKVLAGFDVSSMTTLTHNFPVAESITGISQNSIGAANRSCIHANEAHWSCDIRISAMINQIGNTLPAPLPIDFLNDNSNGSPADTSTVASVTGAPIGLGKTAYVRVVASSTTLDLQGKPFIPQGNVSIQVDGTPKGSGNVIADLADGNAVADIPIGTPSFGPHTIAAHFSGNGSFNSSDAPGSSFSVIAANNVSVGDTSVYEGDSGTRVIDFPVVLSKGTSTEDVQVGWSLQAGTGAHPATVADPKTNPHADVIAASGILSFSPNSTVRYVVAKVLGDTTVESNETFNVVLTSLTPDYVIRRGSLTSPGIGTIIDDDGAPHGLELALGAASIAEGDAGGAHGLKVPITLSSKPSTLVVVNVQLSSNALHGSAKKGASWNGPINRRITFSGKQVSKLITIPTYPNTKDQQDLPITVHIQSVISSAHITTLNGTSTATILTDE